jgi:hypothetical protein
MSLLKTEIFDRGTSQKVPLFLYPNNNIEYYDGPIPQFHKTIISQDVINVIQSHFDKELTIYDGQEIIDYLFKDKTDGLELSEIVVEDERILIFYNDSFNFFDIIFIDELIKMEDCYDKELIGTALSIMSNLSKKHYEMIEDIEDLSEEDKLENIETVEFRKIMKTLEYKHQGDKTILNPYTLELVKTIKEITPILHEFNVYMDLYTDNSSPFLPIYITSEVYDVFIYGYGSYIHEKEYFSLPVEFNNSGEKYSYMFNQLESLSEDIQNKFNNIYNKWQTYQEKKTSVQTQHH